jgi:hypothetical protein
MKITDIIPGRIYRFRTLEESNDTEAAANRFEVLGHTADGAVSYRRVGTDDPPTRRSHFQFAELFEPADSPK